MMHLDPWRAQTLGSPTVPLMDQHHLCLSPPPSPFFFFFFALSFCLPFEKIKLLSRTKHGPLHHAQRKSSFEANRPFPLYTLREKMSCSASTAWLEVLTLFFRHGVLVKFQTSSFPSLNRAYGMSCKGPTLLLFLVFFSILPLPPPPPPLLFVSPVVVLHQQVC